MAPKKWIDKNSATTYKLLHRPQNDPLIHDATASSMVFQEVDAPQVFKKGAQNGGRDLQGLASELRSQAGESEFSLRDNEGEAAEYGVYFDDSQYDYMQHLRDLGEGEGNGFFVEAAPVNVKGKGKGKGVSLDEALRSLDLEHERKQREEAGKLIDESILPSKNLTHVTYQNQQDIPDALKGFQPDMDWRLREALEALDDDAFVDEDAQDMFDELAEGQEEIDEHDFEEKGYQLDNEDDGWESDRTAKPDSETKSTSETLQPPADSIIDTDAAPRSNSQLLPPSDAAPPDALSDPLAAFHAHKAQSGASKPKQTLSTASAVKGRRMHGGAAASTVLTNTSFMSGRQKRRKGALTNPSAYSMTSSALARTEGQTLLDARFDKVLETQYEQQEEEDEEDEEGGRGYRDDIASVATGLTGNESLASDISVASSRAPELVHGSYDGVMGMMDDFLGGFGGGPAQPGDGKASKRKGGKVRRGYGGQTGMEQLDEIRKGLGRPRLAGVR